jgi:hypothetical protein
MRNGAWIARVSAAAAGQEAHGDGDCTLQQVLHDFEPSLCPAPRAPMHNWAAQVLNSSSRYWDLRAPQVCDSKLDLWSVALGYAGLAAVLLCVLAAMPHWLSLLGRATRRRYKDEALRKMRRHLRVAEAAQRKLHQRLASKFKCSSAAKERQTGTEMTSSTASISVGAPIPRSASRLAETEAIAPGGTRRHSFMVRLLCSQQPAALSQASIAHRSRALSPAPRSGSRPRDRPASRPSSSPPASCSSQSPRGCPSSSASRRANPTRPSGRSPATTAHRAADRPPRWAPRRPHPPRRAGRSSPRRPRRNTRPTRSTGP